jgi:hypothetical protein
MSERCDSITAVTTRGRACFLPAINHSGTKDSATTHVTGAPVLCTEFGGVNIALGGKDTHHERGWGYTTASDSNDLLARIEGLCMAVVEKGHVCGFVWTQLTDIEQETNGLYTYDRRPKLEPARVKAVVEKAARKYLSFTTHFPTTTSFRGGLKESCRSFRLEGDRYLVADCAVDGSGGKYEVARLDLNDCLTNHWGRLQWAKGGNFKASARRVRLMGDGTVLEAEAGDGKGWVRNEVRLEERVRNYGGRLVFV